MTFNRISPLNINAHPFDHVGFWFVSEKLSSHFGIIFSQRDILQEQPASVYDYEGELYDYFGKSLVRCVQMNDSEDDGDYGDVQIHRAYHEQPRQRSPSLRLEFIPRWDLFRGTLMGKPSSPKQHLLVPDRFTYTGAYSHYNSGTDRFDKGWFELQEGGQQNKELLRELLEYKI